MHPDKTSLAALIGSRICHDLINPIGAISNGLELMTMASPEPNGPEMTLIQQSCDNATARIRFFRIAFGSADDHRLVPVAEARKTLIEHYWGTRITPVWDIQTDLGRRSVQLGYLAVLCLESALPQGGKLSIQLDGNDIRVTAIGNNVVADLALWDLLDQKSASDGFDLRPAHVQFGLLAQLCIEHREMPTSVFEATSATLSVPLPDKRG